MDQSEIKKIVESDDEDKLIQYLNLFKKCDLKYKFCEYNFMKNDFQNNLEILQNSFNDLPIDKYYNNKRLRAFSLLKIENDINIVGNLNFYQSSHYNNYNGNINREYENISTTILNNECFKNIIFIFNDIVSNEIKQENKFVQIHKIRVYANKDSTNLIPEGIHQDGYNMIAICCIKRENIKGGVSRIYDIDKNIIYSKELEQGEMIVINDMKYYHDVTNIELVDSTKSGYRDVIVLTTMDKLLKLSRL